MPAAGAFLIPLPWLAGRWCLFAASNKEQKSKLPGYAITLQIQLYSINISKPNFQKKRKQKSLKKSPRHFFSGSKDKKKTSTLSTLY